MCGRIFCFRLAKQVKKYKCENKQMYISIFGEKKKRPPYPELICLYFRQIVQVIIGGILEHPDFWLKKIYVYDLFQTYYLKRSYTYIFFNQLSMYSEITLIMIQTICLKYRHTNSGYDGRFLYIFSNINKVYVF